MSKYWPRSGVRQRGRCRRWLGMAPPEAQSGDAWSIRRLEVYHDARVLEGDMRYEREQLGDGFSVPCVHLRLAGSGGRTAVAGLAAEIFRLVDTEGALLMRGHRPERPAPVRRVPPGDRFSSALVRRRHHPAHRIRRGSVLGDRPAARPVHPAAPGDGVPGRGTGLCCVLLPGTGRARPEDQPDRRHAHLYRGVARELHAQVSRQARPPAAPVAPGPREQRGLHRQEELAGVARHRRSPGSRAGRTAAGLGAGVDRRRVAADHPGAGPLLPLTPDSRRAVVHAGADLSAGVAAAGGGAGTAGRRMPNAWRTRWPPLRRASTA